jgi:hypothetical protein
VGGRAFAPDLLPRNVKSGGIWVGGSSQKPDGKRGGIWVGGTARNLSLPTESGGIWVGGTRTISTFPRPILNAVAPLWGRPGDVVVLTGRFDNVQSVQFEGQDATFETTPMLSSGNNTITAQVPLAGTGIITVNTAGGRVRSSQIFTVFDPVATLRRGTVSIDTPVLDNLDLWQGTISLGASYSALRLSTSEPAWVRIYNSVAAQSADAARAFGDPPATPRGLIIDEVTTVGNLAVVLQGLGIGGVVGSNLDQPFGAGIPVTIQNRSSEDVSINLSVLRLLLENQPPPPDTVEFDAALIVATPQLELDADPGFTATGEIELDGDPGFNFEEI